MQNFNQMHFEHQRMASKRSSLCLKNVRNKDLVNSKLSGGSSINVLDVDITNIKSYESSVVKIRYIQNKSDFRLAGEKMDTTRYFKNTREKSFLILSGIVLIFLTCNIPRLLVKLYVISSGGDGKDHFENCLQNNRLPVPAFIMIMGRC